MFENLPTKALRRLYGEKAESCELQLRSLIPASTLPVMKETTNAGIWLLAYPTHLTSTENSGLGGLDIFLASTRNVFSHIHVLPPFISGGDFGFAPRSHIDLDAGAGTWQELRRLMARASVSIDLILNHVDVAHPWFEAALSSTDDEADRYFIRVNPAADFSSIARSRHHPPVTAFRDQDGNERYYWTRYGSSQIDLNYREPEVLVSMASVLIEYARRGVSGLRLDALAFVWKDLARLSANEPEVLDILEVFRWLANQTGIADLIAEGDVRNGHSAYVTPDGRRATIAYRYESAPIVLATILRAENSPFVNWIVRDGQQLNTTAAFNFLSTHDGVYLRPTDPPLLPEDLEILVDATRANGGTVVERLVGNSVVPYELDISVIDLLDAGGDGADRLRAGLTIVCWLPGTPLIYLGHLLGIRNHELLVRTSGDERARSRGQKDLDEALRELQTGLGARVIDLLEEFRHIQARSDAFAADAEISLGPNFGPSVISVVRSGSTSRALCLLALGEAIRVYIPDEFAEFRSSSQPIALDPWQSIVLLESSLEACA